MRVGRAGVAAVAALVLSASLAVPAGADGPRDRKREVDRAAAALEATLDEHTREVASAVRTLHAAESRLPAARRALAEARDEVVTAKAGDAAAAARLSVARSRESDATRELAVVSKRLDGTRDRMGDIAREAYQRGSMAELGLVMQAESPDDLTDRVAGVDAVLDSQQESARRLADDRAHVASRRARLEALREEVAGLRAQAAERLRRTKAAEVRARAAAKEVSRLVEVRRHALDEARAAKAEDARHYRHLQRESARLQKVLAARASAAGATRSAPAPGGGGSPSAPSHLRAPVSGPVTSPYGMRVHPITGVYKLHDGTDFGVACGVPVRAAASGTVVRAAALTGYGNQVALDHGTVRGVGLATSYNHLSGFAVRTGQRVSRGQVIGYVGSTGYSTGCHLHFMVYTNGRTTNPVNWL